MGVPSRLPYSSPLESPYQLVPGAACQAGQGLGLSRCGPQLPVWAPVGSTVRVPSLQSPSALSLPCPWKQCQEEIQAGQVATGISL